MACTDNGMLFGFISIFYFFFSDFISIQIHFKWKIVWIYSFIILCSRHLPWELFRVSFLPSAPTSSSHLIFSNSHFYVTNCRWFSVHNLLHAIYTIVVSVKHHFSLLLFLLSQFSLFSGFDEIKWEQRSWTGFQFSVVSVLFTLFSFASKSFVTC